MLLTDLRPTVGDGDEAFEFQSGAYRETGGDTTWRTLRLGRPYGHDPTWTWPLVDADDERVGELQVSTTDTDTVLLRLLGDGNRVRFDLACTGDDHFVGGGQHAMDLDHVGEAFALWVSEPGIGKTDDEDPPDDWYLTGTRHASSYPDPFFLRPEPVGVLLSTSARVEVDLCTADRWTLDAWEGAAALVVLDAETPLDVVRRRALLLGPVAEPPDWAYGPWNDAVGGEARVREVAATLRAAGAPSSLIWTEDWKGAEYTAWGYHLLPEWELDASLYPEPARLDADLDALGFKWLAYFAPFLVEGTRAWDEASHLAVQTAEGEPYTFVGATLEPTSVLDLWNPEARAWAAAKMETVVGYGFDGWMADFAEWLPTDAVVQGADAMADHNDYPLLWQALSAEVLADVDGVFFTRSGWSGTPQLSPVGWAGDQWTSFGVDDGYPTILPMTLGAAVSGQAWYGSDIAGYQSFGIEPSTKELWFRWCTLGALSPVMRTHHGASKDENWQFDSDAETLEHHARWARVHAALYPYRRGLGAEAARSGTPIALPPFLVWPAEPWDRIDAWALGPSLFVAPVLEEGAVGREVDLPAGVTWYDFWTGAPAADGWVDAPVAEIPVFAPAGAVVPMLATPPDTFVPGARAGVTTLADVDGERVVRVYAGAPGSFVEADGTAYTSDGAATTAATASATLTSGALSAGGLTLTVTGTVPRTYTLEVYAP